MRIFLDANVLFSASNAGSNIHGFITILYEKYELIASVYVFQEAERNIILKRPEWLECFRKITSKIILVPDTPLHAGISLAEKDKPVLGSAIAEKCNYLLTGDKRDFGHLYGRIIEGVTVINYITLAETLLRKTKG